MFDSGFSNPGGQPFGPIGDGPEPKKDSVEDFLGRIFSKGSREEILSEIQKAKNKIRGSADGLVIPKRLDQIEMGSSEEFFTLMMLTLLFGYFVANNMAYLPQLANIMTVGKTCDAALKSYYDGTYKITFTPDNEFAYWECYTDGKYGPVSGLPKVKHEVPERKPGGFNL